MRPTLLVLLTLLCAARAEPADPITPERAEAIFAWFDQLPLPGLHGTEFVRVWPGGRWKSLGQQLEPDCFLAFLLKDEPMSFRVLAPNNEEKTYAKHGVGPDEKEFVGFRKISLLDEAPRFLSETRDISDTYVPRDRMFSQTFSAFGQYADIQAQYLALARWSAQLGDKDLAVSFLNVLRTKQLDGLGRKSDSLETTLQKVFSPVLRAQAYRAFGDKKLLRSDLLAAFQKIVALCPDADLSKEKDAIQILERMIREDAAHPPLTDEQLAALPPEARAGKLVFRLRDEVWQVNPNVGQAGVLPDNSALLALEKLDLAAAPALVKALGDDSFTRQVGQRFTGVNLVRDDALAALQVISGCSFVHSTNTAGAYRIWWHDVSEKGEKHYLMERIAADDANYADFAHQLLKKYADHAIPFLIETTRGAAELTERVTLSKDLWKLKDPRCLSFFARQVLEGRELGDRVTAAYGLRFLHDARAVPAMCAEWNKLVAAKNGSGWPAIDESDPAFDNPWSVADFLATSNAPEACLGLGEGAASLPVEWRAKIVSRLADFSGGKIADTELPSEGAKKAIEDVLHGFLTDAADDPFDTKTTDLIGAGRVCDLAGLELHELWPQRYEFNRWLSPTARTRQCLASFNVRAHELGDPLSPLPPETPQKSFAAETEKIVSEVTIAPPFDKLEFGARITALRSFPLDANSLVAALLPIFSQPEKETPGFVLNIARFRDAPGISIQLLPLLGPSLDPKDFCQENLLANIDTQTPSTSRYRSQLNFQRWSNAQAWQLLLQALESVAAEPPQTAFTVGLHFTSQPGPRSVFIRAIPKAVVPNQAPH